MLASIARAFQTRRPVTLGDFKVALQISDLDFFNLLERKFLSGSVVKLSRPWRFVVRNGLGVLKRASVLEIGRDAGGSKRMAASGIGAGGRLGPPLDHMEDVEPRHRLA